MKPYLHGKVSVKRFGGREEDYQDIHDFLDSSKVAHPDMRHRALLHNSWGCFIVEQVFGIKRVNSSGREYSPRDVAEQHIIDDLGRIPTVSDYLDGMPMYEWLGGPRRPRDMNKTATGESIVD